MRRGIACLCLLLFCLPAASALAEPLVYTGASGFTLTLPDDWEAVFGGDEEDEDFIEDLRPGEEEALFCSADGILSVTVYFADDAPVDPHAAGELFSEAALEARVSGLNGYQKLYYRYDELNLRAFLSYTLMDSMEGVVNIEYLVGFVTGSEIEQYITLSVRQDRHEACFPLIGEIVNSIDVGGIREDAEG